MSEKNAYISTMPPEELIEAKEYANKDKRTLSSFIRAAVCERIQRMKTQALVKEVEEGESLLNTNSTN